MITRFIIHNIWLLDLLFVLVVPAILILCGYLVYRHKSRTSKRTSHLVPRTSKFLIILGLLLSAIYVYGRFVGTRQLEVQRVELSFADLPEAFDGYRLVQVSDLHVGSLPDGVLHSVVDSINAQKPGLILFTGDLINSRSDELKPYISELKRLKAADAVVSVVGNHDYGFYETEDVKEAYMDEGRVVNMQQDDLKWRVLLNEHRWLYAPDSSRIAIAGMEDDGQPPFSDEHGNLGMTLRGIRRSDFVIMLEHNPDSWRRKILRHCHAQLTLSGHTHGGQLSLFGLSPAALRFHCYNGLYTIADRHLYVSKGVGGAIPFRLGAKPEIVVITLKKKEPSHYVAIPSQRKMNQTKQPKQ